MFKVIELFAGIGAQREALTEAEFECEVVAISEIDKYASIAYQYIHGKTLNLGDIRKIESLPMADLWTYSFPCTDISLAGRLKGFTKEAETSSSLLWEVERLLEVAKSRSELPRFLLLENVKNLVSKKFMPDFKVWLDYLESLGYKKFYKVMNAKDYVVPQNRERVFMISILDCKKDFVFPEKLDLKCILKDYLESEVDEKYFLSDKLINNFIDMKDRNGFVRGLRFNPHDANSKYAFTISTNPGLRATDNFIICPAALRGRLDVLGIYKQKLEIKDEQLINTITTVTKDNLIVIIPENTKKGYAIK